MTRCVVVLGLLCVEMCLVQSWFGLCSFLFFYLNLARRCYCCLLRWSACLLSSSFFWDCIYFIFVSLFFAILTFSTHALTLTSCPQICSRPRTHTPAHTTTPHNLTSLPLNPSLCFSVNVSPVADCGSCFLAVTESQWASKERWQ